MFTELSNLLVTISKVDFNLKPAQICREVKVSLYALSESRKSFSFKRFTTWQHMSAMKLYLWSICSCIDRNISLILHLAYNYWHYDTSYTFSSFQIIPQADEYINLTHQNGFQNDCNHRNQLCVSCDFCYFIIWTITDSYFDDVL